MKKIIFTTLLLAISLISFSQTADFEFKDFKTTQNGLNVYFNIFGITESMSTQNISTAIETDQNVISCRVFKSSYGSDRCQIISTANLNADDIREILLSQNLDYEFNSVIINNKDLIRGNNQ